MGADETEPRGSSGAQLAADVGRGLLEHGFALDWDFSKPGHGGGNRGLE
jgi:hypothetical protein